MALIFSMHSVHWRIGGGKWREKRGGGQQNRQHWSLMKCLFLSALHWKERVHSPDARHDCLLTFALAVARRGFSSSADREWGGNKREQQHESFISTCLVMQTNTVAKQLRKTVTLPLCVWRARVPRAFVFLGNYLFVNPNQMDISFSRHVFPVSAIFILAPLLTVILSVARQFEDFLEVAQRVSEQKVHAGILLVLSYIMRAWTHGRNCLSVETI